MTALQSFFISVMASVISYLLYIDRHFWNQKCRNDNVVVEGILPYLNAKPRQIPLLVMQCMSGNILFANGWTEMTGNQPMV